MRRVCLALALIALSLSSVTLADHLPEKDLARGRPETSLAGVDLSHAKLADIIKLYGRPTKVEGVDTQNPRIVDSFDYTWVKSGLNLRVVVQRSSVPTKFEYVSAIEVEVGTSRRNGRTGAGLRLGDTVRDLRRIYGNRFRVHRNSKYEVYAVTIQWRREEYSLSVSLDEHDRIVALSLYAPE